MIDEIADSSEIKKVIFASRKPGIFIAGADVTEFTAVASPDQAREYVRLGQASLPQAGEAPANDRRGHRRRLPRRRLRAGASVATGG